MPAEAVVQALHPQSVPQPQPPLPGCLPACGQLTHLSVRSAGSHTLSVTLTVGSSSHPQAPQSLGCYLAPPEEAAQACGNTLQPLRDPCSHLSLCVAL